jgi:hypothetical protein
LRPVLRDTVTGAAAGFLVWLYLNHQHTSSIREILKKVNPLYAQSYSQAGHKKSLPNRRGGGGRPDSTYTYDIVRIRMIRIRIVRVRMIYHYFAYIYFLFVSYLLLICFFLISLPGVSFLFASLAFLSCTKKSPPPTIGNRGRGFLSYGTAAYAGVISRGSVGSGGNIGRCESSLNALDSVR